MTESVYQIVRFALVGGVVTGTFMALNHGLGRWFSRNTAFLVAYPPAVTLHYLLNKLWTFEDSRPTSTTQLSQYAIMTAVAFALQWGMFRLLCRYTRWPAWLASGAATVAQMALAFVAMRFWVFATGGGAA